MEFGAHRAFRKYWNYFAKLGAGHLGIYFLLFSFKLTPCVIYTHVFIKYFKFKKKSPEKSHW